MSSRAVSAWVKTTGMVVQHNMNALNSYNKLNANVAGMKKSSEKLSSGYRINRAGDDAAGLAISEKMRSQIKGLNQAIRNSQDGINMIQTFEGAAQESHSILQRMKELASESANGTYDNPTDRAAMQLEFDQLNDELNQIADTDFNGTVVLNGGKMADGAKADSTGLIDYNNQVRNATDIGSSKLWGTVDDSMYNKAAADQLWTATGTSGKVDTIKLSFTYDGTTWKSDNAGVKVEAADINNGGFTIKTTDENGATENTVVAKALFDSSDKIAGDTVTLTFTGGEAKTQIPGNFGVKDDTYNDEKAAGIASPTFAITLDDATKIDKSVGAALKKLESGVSIGATWNATGDKLVLKDAGNAIDSTVQVAGTTIDAKDTYVKVDNDSGLYAKVSETGVFTFAALKDGGDVGTPADFIEIGTVTNDTTAATVKSKTLEYTVQVDKPKYDGVDNYNVSVATSNNMVSVADSFDKSVAKLTYTNDITLQVGARSKDAVNFTFNYNSDGSADMGTLKANLDISSRADGLNTANLSLSTQEDANAAIDQIDKAINKVSMVRATFGSIQNRLEHKITNLTTTSENLTEAESAIRDTDMASEMMNYTKFNILQQAAQSMLAQANQQPQSILQLLG